MTTNTTNGSAGPLAHIKVLDLTIARAGPTCVRVLADHGAQVTQVLRPEQGGLDASFPAFDRENLHRNKRSLALNLQTDAGRAVFYRMAKDADVVVENFRSEVKYRLKVDYETLKADQPAHRLRQQLGFRPGRPVRQAARRRSDRARAGRA